MGKGRDIKNLIELALDQVFMDLVLMFESSTSISHRIIT